MVLCCHSEAIMPMREVDSVVISWGGGVMTREAPGLGRNAVVSSFC